MPTPDNPDAPQPRWYCIHSKPKCEHLVAAALKQFPEVEGYCPRLRFQRVTPRGKVWFTEALFPSYLFARFDWTQSHRAVKYSNNVLRIVEFGGEPAPVPDQIIENLKLEMNDLDVREIQFGVKVGDTVEVAEGPMRGLKGIVERIASGEERVRILLEFLGRQNFVEVPINKVISERQPREGMKRRASED